MQYNITYRQKDKGWQYIISYKDAKGLWRQKSKQGFDMKKTAKKAAEERLEQLKKEVETAIRVEPQYRGITFGQFAEELMEHEKLYKAYNTISSMDAAVKRFCDIKNIAPSEVKQSDIQKCVDKCIRDGLKISTVKAYLRSISYIFSQMVDPYKIISVSPVSGVKIPALQYDDEAKKERKLNALTKTETDLFLAELKKYQNPIYYYFAAIALATGLREGELLGLTWDKVDLARMELSVKRQWKLLEKGKYGFGTLKKKNSDRIIPIAQSTKQIFSEYKENYNVVDFNNRVFSLTPIAIGKAMRVISRKIGIPVSPHTLRHTYATNLIANGVDFKTAAALLGHDVEMTMRIYSHVTDDMMEAAAKKINSIF